MQGVLHVLIENNFDEIGLDHRDQDEIGEELVDLVQTEQGQIEEDQVVLTQVDQDLIQVDQGQKGRELKDLVDQKDLLQTSQEHLIRELQLQELVVILVKELVDQKDQREERDPKEVINQEKLLEDNQHLLVDMMLHNLALKEKKNKLNLQEDQDKIRIDPLDHLIKSQVIEGVLIENEQIDLIDHLDHLIENQLIESQLIGVHLIENDFLENLNQKKEDKKKTGVENNTGSMTSES